MRKRRSWFIIGALASATLSSACMSSMGIDFQPTPEVALEDEDWDPSLHIDLDTMIRHDSGLYYYDTVVGTGTAINGLPSISVFYSGYLADGFRFTHVPSTGSPDNFGLANLIAGWRIGLQGMREGGTRRLIIPARLGYGPNGFPPSVPSNANLVFDIQLLDAS